MGMCRGVALDELSGALLTPLVWTLHSSVYSVPQLTDMLTQFTDLNTQSRLGSFDSMMSAAPTSGQMVKFLQQVADVQRRRVGRVIRGIADAFGMDPAFISIFGSSAHVGWPLWTILLIITPSISTI